jgi:hypothetical protein
LDQNQAHPDIPVLRVGGGLKVFLAKQVALKVENLELSQRVVRIFRVPA